MKRNPILAGMVGVAFIALFAHPGLAAAAPAEDCPNDGTVRFGVEPLDTAPSWCRSTTTSAS